MKIKTYEVRTPDKIMRIKIPEDWKITYGQTMPGSMTGNRTRRNTNNFSGTPTYTLRVYESENKQRMMIHEVESFRDMSIPVSVGSITRTQTEGAEWGTLEENMEWEELELVDVEDTDAEASA